jgi:hypothetical protein
VSEERPTAANLWFHLPIMAVGVGCCIRFYFHSPETNTSLLVLAFLVGVMMLWEMKGWQKGIYFTVILLLVVIEYRAENNERIRNANYQAAAAASAERDRLDQNSKFQNIADGIHQAISTGTHQFGVTIAVNRKAQDQEQGHFDSLLKQETDLFRSQERELDLQASTEEEVDALYEAFLASARASSAANSAEIAHAQATPVPSSFPSNPLAPTPLTPAETKALQIKGLQMAKEINDWLAEVSQNVPKPTATLANGYNYAAQNADERANQAYMQTLELEWATKFHGEPWLLIHQLHNDQGIMLTCTGNGGNGGLTSFLGLCKSCADRIEQGAMRLQY